jgi:ADP-ribose pyrophosphatase
MGVRRCAAHPSFDTMEKFKLIQSDTVYQGRAFKVRKDVVEMPDGKSGTLDIVHHSNAITIIPIDEEGRIWLVRQYRHASGEVLLELPAGTLDKSELPEVCAHREVREEIGMSASHMVNIGEFYLAPGYSTEYMYVYLATGLKPDPLEMDDDEFLEVEQIPVKEFYHLAESGQIQDAKTLAALFLARSHLLSFVDPE